MVAACVIFSVHGEFCYYVWSGTAPPAHLRGFLFIFLLFRGFCWTQVVCLKAPGSTSEVAFLARMTTLWACKWFSQNPIILKHIFLLLFNSFFAREPPWFLVSDLISEKGVSSHPLTYLGCQLQANSVLCAPTAGTTSPLPSPSCTTAEPHSICRHCARWKWGPGGAATAGCGITFLKYFESNNSLLASRSIWDKVLPCEI